MAALDERRGDRTDRRDEEPTGGAAEGGEEQPRGEEEGAAHAVGTLPIALRRQRLGRVAGGGLLVVRVGVVARRAVVLPWVQ